MVIGNAGTGKSMVRNRHTPSWPQAHNRHTIFHTHGTISLTLSHTAPSPSHCHTQHHLPHTVTHSTISLTLKCIFFRSSAHWTVLISTWKWSQSGRISIPRPSQLMNYTGSSIQQQENGRTDCTQLSWETCLIWPMTIQSGLCWTVMLIQCGLSHWILSWTTIRCVHNNSCVSDGTLSADTCNWSHSQY